MGTQNIVILFAVGAYLITFIVVVLWLNDRYKLRRAAAKLSKERGWINSFVSNTTSINNILITAIEDDATYISELEAENVELEKELSRHKRIQKALIKAGMASLEIISILQDKCELLHGEIAKAKSSPRTHERRYRIGKKHQNKY